MVTEHITTEGVAVFFGKRNGPNLITAKAPAPYSSILPQFDILSSRTRTKIEQISARCAYLFECTTLSAVVCGRDCEFGT